MDAQNEKILLMVPREVEAAGRRVWGSAPEEQDGIKRLWVLL